MNQIINPLNTQRTMSVIIKKIQNTNESNAKANGKWYPRVVNEGNGLP